VTFATGVRLPRVCFEAGLARDGQVARGASHGYKRLFCISGIRTPKSRKR
jgi:hypothetical protein